MSNDIVSTGLSAQTVDSLDEFDAGVFKYIPFNQKGWARKAFLDACNKTEVQLSLAVLAFFVICYICLTIITIGQYRRSKQRKGKSRRSTGNGYPVVLEIWTCLLVVLGWVFLGFAIESYSHISARLSRLTDYAQETLHNATNVLESSLQSIYNILIQHIKHDGEKSDSRCLMKHQYNAKFGSKYSHLCSALNKLKMLIAKQIERLLNSKDVLKSLSTDAQFGTSTQFKNETSSAARKFVNTTEQIIVNIVQLTEAANLLNDSAQRQIMQSLFNYQNSIHLIHNDIVAKTVLRETESLFCPNDNNVTKNTGAHVETCQSVKNNLKRIVEYAEQMSLDRKHFLSGLVSFAAVPKTFQVETQLKKWLPSINKPITYGLPSLLDTYAKVQIDGLQKQIKVEFDKLFTEKSKEALRKYSGLVQSVFLILMAFAGLFLLVMLCVTFKPVKHVCSNQSKNMSFDQLNEECSVGKPDESNGNTVILVTSRRYDSHLHCSLFLAGTLCFLVGIIISTLYLSSSIADSQLCPYLYMTPEIIHADWAITRAIKLTMTNQLIPRDLLDTADIRIAYPENILMTLGSKFPNKNSRLLHSIHLSRPINFTALLDSHWLDSKRVNLWQNVIAAKLNRLDLAATIPDINVTQLLNVISIKDTFDNLNVYPVDAYLVNPGEDLYTPVARFLETQASLQAKGLREYYIAASMARLKYLEEYSKTNEVLEMIRKNKAIIQPISEILTTLEDVFSKLKKSSNADVVKILSELYEDSWKSMRNLVKTDLVPFLLALFDDLFPHSEINRFYIDLTGQICTGVTSDGKMALLENFKNFSCYLTLCFLSLVMTCLTLAIYR